MDFTHLAPHPSVAHCVAHSDLSFVYEEDLLFEKAMLESATQAELTIIESDDGKSETADEMPKAKGKVKSNEPFEAAFNSLDATIADFPTFPNAKDPKPEHGPSKATYQYMITLTNKSGFTPEDIAEVRLWHKNNSEECLLVTELHDSGLTHLHSVITCYQKTAVQITRKLKTLWSSLKFDWTPRISAQVKRVSELIGAFHYLLKDLDGKKPLLLTGWEMSWIEQQCKENLKKVPHSILLKDEYFISKKTGLSLVLQFAKRTAMPLCDKETLKHVIIAMMRDGYQFDNCSLKFLLAQVMVRCGADQYASNLLDNEWQFM